MHALIIEDDLITSEHIKGCSKLLGYTSFSIAMDEDQAIQEARLRCPDLITSDVQLAAGCGIDAVQAICQDKAVPVVYITASPGKVRQRCAEAVLIEKPFASAALSKGVAAAQASRR